MIVTNRPVVCYTINYQVGYFFWRQNCSAYSRDFSSKVLDDRLFWLADINRRTNQFLNCCSLYYSIVFVKIFTCFLNRISFRININNYSCNLMNNFHFLKGGYCISIVSIYRASADHLKLALLVSAVTEHALNANEENCTLIKCLLIYSKLYTWNQ